MPIGPLELGIILVIILVVFGPKRLPGLGKSLGSGMREFKDSIAGNNKDDDRDEDSPSTLAAASSTADADTTASEQRDRDRERDDAVPQPRG
jgi:sec-independent protein translocase protein TatA